MELFENNEAHTKILTKGRDVNQQLVDYAMKFVGVPYKWGGSNPISGLDCSGFVQEVLMAAGLDLPGDQNAQAYYNHFAKVGRLGVRGAGALCFYGNSPTEITHITIMVNEVQCLGANGGDSKTVNRDAADKVGAFIKMRPYNYRKDLVAVILPTWP